jgi:hypothetical protein
MVDALCVMKSLILFMLLQILGNAVGAEPGHAEFGIKSLWDGVSGICLDGAVKGERLSMMVGVPSYRKAWLASWWRAAAVVDFAVAVAVFAVFDAAFEENAVAAAVGDVVAVDFTLFGFGELIVGFG